MISFCFMRFFSDSPITFALGTFIEESIIVLHCVFLRLYYTGKATKIDALLLCQRRLSGDARLAMGNCIALSILMGNMKHIRGGLPALDWRFGLG